MEGTNSLVACAVGILAWVRQLEREALHARITQAFVVACSHYADSIDLEMMSLGFATRYKAFELEKIETVVAPLAWDLANRVEDIVLPSPRGSLVK